jgi:hypothetical protein
LNIKYTLKPEIKEVRKIIKDENGNNVARVRQSIYTFKNSEVKEIHLEEERIRLSVKDIVSKFGKR